MQSLRNNLWICLALSCATAPAVPAPPPAAPVVPAPPAVHLPPARAEAEVRAIAFLRGSIQSPGHLLREASELGQALGLPLDLGALVRARIQAANPTLLFSDQSVAAMDRDQAIGLVGFGEDSEKSPRVVFAIPFKNEAEAARIKKLFLTDSPDRASGVFQKGRSLCFGQTLQDIADACAVAIESQAAVPKGLARLTFDPVALARVKGTTTHATLATLGPLAAAGLSALRAQQAQADAGAANGRKAKSKRMPADKAEIEITPAVETFVPALVNVLTSVAVDVDLVHLDVALDRQQGLLLRLSLEPKAGSASAQRWSKTNPYALDPALPAGGVHTGIISFGSWTESWALFSAAVADASPQGKQLALAQQRWLSISEGGRASCMLEFSPMPLHALCTMPLKKETSPAEAQSAYVAVTVAQLNFIQSLMGGKDPKAKITQKGGIVEVVQQPSVRDLAMQKILWGETVQRSAMTVKNGQVAIAVGKDARAQLNRIPAALGKSDPAAVAAAALARTAGYETVFVVDIARIALETVLLMDTPKLRPVVAMIQAVPGIKEVSAPFVFASSNGKTASYELQLPMASLQSLAKVLQPYFGLLGAQGGGKPASR